MHIPNKAYRLFLNAVINITDKFAPTKSDAAISRLFYWEQTDDKTNSWFQNVDIGTKEVRHFYHRERGLNDSPNGETYESDLVVIAVLEKVGYTIPDFVKIKKSFSVRSQREDTARALFQVLLVNGHQDLLKEFPQLKVFDEPVGYQQHNDVEAHIPEIGKNEDPATSTKIKPHEKQEETKVYGTKDEDKNNTFPNPSGPQNGETFIVAKQESTERDVSDYSKIGDRVMGEIDKTLFVKEKNFSNRNNDAIKDFYSSKGTPKAKKDVSEKFANPDKQVPVGRPTTSIAVLFGLSVIIVTIYIFIKYFPSNQPNKVDYNDGKYDKQVNRNAHRLPLRLATGNNFNRRDTTGKQEVNGEKSNLSIVVDSLDRAADVGDSLKNNQYTYEVKEYSNEHNSSEASVAQMLDPPPREGFGKLAVRSYCDYAGQDYYEAKIKITDSLGRSHGGFVSAMYNTNRRRETTYFCELMPGKYNVKLEYHLIGSAEFEVEVFANKISLYRFKKTNPFGKGFGQIVFTTDDDQTNKWKITLDDIFLGIKTLKPDQGIFIPVKGGEFHSFRIESVVPNAESTTLDVVNDSVFIAIGERFYKSIN